MDWALDVPELIQRAKERAEERDAACESRHNAQKQAPGGKPPRHSDPADRGEHEARCDEHETTREERDHPVTDQRSRRNDPDEPSGHPRKFEGS